MNIYTIKVDLTVPNLMPMMFRASFINREQCLDFLNKIIKDYNFSDLLKIEYEIINTQLKGHVLE